MPPPAFRADLLTAEDVTALQALAPALAAHRARIAAEWSRRLVELYPAYFSAGGANAAQVRALNESFLALIVDHIARADLPALYATYYEQTCRLLSADVQRAPAQRMSLEGLCTSARVCLNVIREQFAPAHAHGVDAYVKLSAQLVMLVGQAYSDTREGYLERAFEQINTLSHELRAPLSHLVGYLQLLRDGEFGAVGPDQARVLEQLSREVDDVLWLLNGTLNLSRLETGQVDVRVEEFRLSAVFAEIVNNTPRLDVPVTWSAPFDLPDLCTDRVKLKQVVGNLVRNALRYGQGSPVTVTATVPKPDWVEISVRDEGPGIKDDELRVIFDFFRRGDAARVARDGFGIGLHVVRRLVQLLGGAIEVDSLVGTGSCFRVTIPSRLPGGDAAPRG
jgi:signal transduction histidine kinase